VDLNAQILCLLQTLPGKNRFYRQEIIATNKVIKKKEGRKNPPLFDYLLERLYLEREAQADLENSVSVSAGYIAESSESCESWRIDAVIDIAARVTGDIKAASA